VICDARESDLEAIVGIYNAAIPGRLATADRSGRPLVVPVCFVLEGSAIYSAIDAKPKRDPSRPLRRMRNVEENPQGSLVVDEYDEDWTRLRYVIVGDGPERQRLGELVEMRDDPDVRGQLSSPRWMRPKSKLTVWVGWTVKLLSSAGSAVPWTITPRISEYEPCSSARQHTAGSAARQERAGRPSLGG